MTIKQLIYNLNWYKFTHFVKPYQLNIVGVRANSTKSNSFDDEMYVFWYDDKQNLQYRIYSISTDPGTFYLHNPITPDGLGSAILKQGQYKDAYMLSLNYRLGGQYNAYELVQSLRPVTIIRDYNRDAILDFYNGREYTGMFNINIHTGTIVGGKSISVDNWSAGCQVFQSYDNWAEFIQLCQKHQNLHGNSFTYTLLDERSLVRAYRRWGMYGLLGAGVGLVGFSAYKILK